MKVTICGGGNIAHALAGMLGNNKSLDLHVLTRKPELWANHLMVELEGNTFFSITGTVTSSFSTAIENSDLILLALPAFARKEVIEKIAPFVKQGAWIGAFPGMGNFDLIVSECFKNSDKKPKIFASQRVPYICRLKQYGRHISISSKKSEIFVSALKQEETVEICQILTSVLEMRVYPLHNFLEITLSTSNPILHPARTYSMFSEYKDGMYWKKNILFYEDWSQDSSELLIKMDEEVHRIIDAIPFDLSGVKPLLQHYEVKTCSELTNKIQNITAFKGITSPMKQTEFGWVPDFESRYFTEDISYGLIIIKSIAQILNIQVPAIDKVIGWAQYHMKRQFVTNGNLLWTLIKDVPLHQNFGLTLPKDFISYYKQPNI